MVALLVKYFSTHSICMGNCFVTIGKNVGMSLGLLSDCDDRDYSYLFICICYNQNDL